MSLKWGDAMNGRTVVTRWRWEARWFKRQYRGFRIWWADHFGGAFNVEWFGASVDRDDNSLPIQRAVDHASQQGGARQVVLPAGSYRTTGNLESRGAAVIGQTERWRGEARNTQRGFVLWLAVGALLWVTVLSLWALL